MQIFRQLAGNIFFKFILGLVALSFVFFGVSGFILGSPNSWVAKVGSETVGISAFNNSLRSDKAIILSTTKSPEALQYLESAKFKKDVLGRLINKLMVENLSADFGVSASKKILLEAIVKDSSFKGENGKFDREKFKKFLARSGFDEKRYVDEIANEVSSVMILQSMSMAVPVNYTEVFERESFKQEKRLADVITISESNLSSSATKITKAELEEFFEQNKRYYEMPEMREISYLRFSKKNFSEDFKVSDQDIFAEYDRNKATMMEPEKRDFYQLAFDDEAQAKVFSETLNKSDPKNTKADFAKLAKKLQNKGLKDISMDGFSERDMFESLAKPTFALGLGKVSMPIQSPVGFHVFLVNKISKPKQIPFSEVKTSIRISLISGREEKILQEKISEIDEILLTSNSLQEVAKKFHFHSNKSITIGINGEDEKGRQPKILSEIEGLAENAFALKEGQVSKIFYDKNANGFYILKLEKIIAAHDRELSEVKAQVMKNLSQEKSLKEVKKLARKIAKEVAENTQKASQIAAKYRVKFQRKHEFSRYLSTKIRGENHLYQSPLLQELFDLEINKSSTAVPSKDGEFKVVILKNIIAVKPNSDQLLEAQDLAMKELGDEIMGAYNSYLLDLYPIKVNEKFFANQEAK